MFDIAPNKYEYIRERILELKEKSGLSMTQFAEISGCNRAVLHKILGGKANPGLNLLLQLSEHFKISMNFWFLPRKGIKVSPIIVQSTPAVREKAIPSMLPLTKKMVQAISRVPRTDKRHLIVLAIKYPDLIKHTVKLAQLLEKMEVKRRKKMVKAMEIIALDNICEPAP